MCLIEFVQSTNNDSLFSSNREALDKLISQSKERVNVVGFQGRLLGFQVLKLESINAWIFLMTDVILMFTILHLLLYCQFCKSVRGPLKVVGSLMAAFSQVFNTSSIFKHTIVSPHDCKFSFSYTTLQFKNYFKFNV